MEQLLTARPLQDILQEVNDATPLLIGSVKPENGDEQKHAFLNGSIDEPQHDYKILREIDYAGADSRLERLGAELQSHPDLNPKYHSTYGDFINYRRKINRLLYCASAINNGDADEKLKAQQEYDNLNEQLYGTVDHETYVSILASKMHNITIHPADSVARGLMDELRSMLPVEAFSDSGDTFRPSGETFAVIQHAAGALYEKLIGHVRDRDDPYNASEIKTVLDDIISEEFGDSAEGWRVVLVSNPTLQVVASKKEVHVYEKMESSAAKLRGRVVHEIGVHMLRAVRGSETDLLPMEIGMAGYEAAEEGLGMVLQQAVEGKYELAGAGHYITAGFMKDGHGFRDTYEMKWRMGVLGSYKPGKDISAATVAKAQANAYGQVMRIARGTDIQPLLKDLSYYNGAKAMWEFFERYQDDELMLNLALLGKLDPSKPANIRIALETQPK